MSLSCGCWLPLNPKLVHVGTSKSDPFPTVHFLDTVHLVAFSDTAPLPPATSLKPLQQHCKQGRAQSLSLLSLLWTVSEVPQNSHEWSFSTPLGRKSENFTSEAQPTRKWDSMNATERYMNASGQNKSQRNQPSAATSTNCIYPKTNERQCFSNHGIVLFHEVSNPLYSSLKLQT